MAGPREAAENDGSLLRVAVCGHEHSTWPSVQMGGDSQSFHHHRRNPIHYCFGNYPPRLLVILDKQDGLILKKEGFQYTLLNVAN